MNEEASGTVRGLVKGSGLVAADLNLTVGDGLSQGKTVRGQFELASDSGLKYLVDSNDCRLIGQRVKLEGRFGELAGHPLLAPFKVNAGPHVGIKLEGTAVQGGDEVILCGRADNGQEVSGPEGTRYFTARVIFSGPEAGRLLAKELEKNEAGKGRKPKDGTRLGIIRGNLWAAYLIPVLALCFFTLGGFDGLRLLAMALLLCGAVFAARRRAVPTFHALEHHDKETETVDGTAERWPTWDFILGCFIFTVFIGVTLAAVEAAAKLMFQFSPFLALIPAATGMFYLRNRQGPSIKRLRAILRAPSLPDQAAEGAYGSARGKLYCADHPGVPGPVSCVWCEIRTYDADTGKAGGSIAHLSRAGKELAVDTGKEAIGVKRGRGALWASALRVERRTSGWKQLYQNIGGNKIDTEDYIPDGSQVLAAGRISNLGGQRVFSSEGTESLLLFASGKRSPTTTIRLTIAAYVLTGLLILLAAAGPGVWGLVGREKSRTINGLLEKTETLRQ